jgi:hypothetical protein
MAARLGVDCTVSAASMPDAHEHDARPAAAMNDHRRAEFAGVGRGPPLPFLAIGRSLCDVASHIHTCVQQLHIDRRYMHGSQGD